MLIEGLAGLGSTPAPVCIVGSGPVGLALAVDLTKRGVRCILLESGGLEPTPEIQSLSDAERIEPRRHDDMRIAVARRLGGTSHLWGGRCLPFDPVDFMPRPGVDARWPIDYEDMTAWLEPAVEATSSGAAVYQADRPLAPSADGDFSADTLERWVNVQASSALHRHIIRHDPLIEVRTHATVTNMRFAENGAVRSLEVKHSLSGEQVDLPVQHLVLATGGLETARLLLAAAGPDSGRFGSGAGPLGKTYMGHVIGEIADIVFADAGTAKAMDFHIDAHGSYVRRRFVASAETQLREGLLNAAFWPVVPPVSDARHGNAILSLVYLALRDPRIGSRVVAEAIRQRHIPDPPPPVWPHLANLVTGLPSAVMFSADFFRRRYFSRHRLPGFFVQNRARRYALAYHGEQVPDARSRVWLTGERDRLGLPRLAIDLRFAAADARSLVATHDLMDRWLRRNGIGALEYAMPMEEREAAILNQASHGTHQIGLARMGVSRAEGVVDGNLQSFDAPNLHLAGCAVLPTSGQANPTLTAVALALRLGDRLARLVA